ncbi:hypothetical protein MBLNU457_g1099t1 [Dothideomycetes sp. NU457]
MQSTTSREQSTALSSLTDFIESRARHLASHSWEYGTLSHALLSLHNPELTVFSPSAFPHGNLPELPLPLPAGLAYAQEHISVTADTLYPSDQGSVSDPASLGTAALLLGVIDHAYATAAYNQLNHIKNSRRHENGAISHREDIISLWADAVAMVPPFWALWAVAASNTDHFERSIDQIRAYRAELLLTHQSVNLPHKADISIFDDDPVSGSWRHIVSSWRQSEVDDDVWTSSPRDNGPWSTSNAWVLWGITRVLATIMHYRPAQNVPHFPVEIRKAELAYYAREVIDAAIRTDDHESGLLRNYWGDAMYSGETSGTALITAAIYRLVALDEPRFSHYLTWADKKRRILEGCVREDGVVGPAANALNHFDKEPIEGGSAEGQAFMLEMIAAFRDWEKKTKESGA